MVEAVVDLLLNELYRVVREEVKLSTGVKEEIVNLREELKMMKAILRDVDVKILTHLIHYTWKQMREVAYEIHDVVDDYMLQVANGDGDDAGDAHNTCTGRICSPFRKLKGKSQIVLVLQSVKEKAKQIRELLAKDMAELLKTYGPSGLSHSPLHLSNQGLSSSTGRVRLEMEQYRRSIVALVDESKLVGIDQTKNKLVHLLNDGDTDLKVIAIVGKGGMGKTTLARQIYREMSYFQRRAFVTVSQTSNEEYFLEDMTQQLFPKEMLEMQHFKIDQLKEEIRERLGHESYLIVVDEVRNTNDWDQIKYLFPTNNNGSRVVVTTEQEKPMAEHFSSYKFDVYRLEPLSNDASWELFCKHTFPTTQTCPYNLVAMCQDIVFNKCMGVPITILAISGLLRIKNECDLQAWVKNVKDRLQYTDAPQMTRKILSLSLEILPYPLKLCCIYLSIFPENYEIEWKRVIRLWVSEGFVGKRGGRMVEKDAESYLWELVHRNLIQIVEIEGDGTITPKVFLINGFLWDILREQTEEERLFEVMEKPIWMDKKARRLSVDRSHDELKGFVQIIPIRSLLMFYVSARVGVDADGLKFRLLGVLDLEGAPLDSFPKEIFTLLLLRYLSLRRTRISNILESIGNLSRLETLDLTYTLVAELPDQISMLKNLCHLLIYHRDEESMYAPYESCGAKVTPNIGGLVWLQELYLIEVREKGEIVKALGNLTQLRKLGLIRLKEEDCREVCWCISRMRKLRSLTLQTNERFELKYLRSPPAGMEELRLDGLLEEFPSWMSPSSLRNLQVLGLYNTRLKKDPGASLGSFPKLAGLFLYHEALDEGVKMQVLLPGSFPSLRSLVIDDRTFRNQALIDEVMWERIISNWDGEHTCPIYLDIVHPSLDS